jgi:hypothetical protein
VSIYDFGVGGYDVVFTAPDLSSGQWIRVSSKAGITATDVASPLSAKTIVQVGYLGGKYYLSVLDKSAITVDTYTSQDLAHLGAVRIVFHNEFITVYVQDYWIHTFWFDSIYHPEEQEVKMSASGSLAITNVRLKELADWREAIFVDMETSSQNAISSVILQRPIDIRSGHDGEMIFEYDPPRSTETVKFVRQYTTSESETGAGCSDAVVYFTNAAVVIDDDYAEQVGFVTRMYRFPDLDNGAIRAARIAQKRARQSRKMHTATCRFHPRLEVGDIASIAFPATSTSRPIVSSFIVESIDFNMENGVQSMKISGRDSTL